MTFRIESLLEYSVGGKRSGPMSPVLFAKEMQKQTGVYLHELLRVHLDNQEINNWYEAPGKRELTGSDTLVIVTRCRNCRQFAMYVDLGHCGVPVAIWFSNDDVQDITTTPIYDQHHFEKKLSKDDLIAIFQACKEKEIELYKLHKEMVHNKTELNFTKNKT
jgi:hypothetical protein